MNAPEYELELRLDGVLIGDVRRLAQNLVWERRRTINGVDSISFTLNDVLFEQWCNDRSTSIVDVLKPKWHERQSRPPIRWLSQSLRWSLY